MSLSASPIAMTREAGIPFVVLDRSSSVTLREVFGEDLVEPLSASAVAWLGYGLVRADPAITLGGAGGGVMASVILVALAAERLPRRQLRIV